MNAKRINDAAQRVMDEAAALRESMGIPARRGPFGGLHANHRGAVQALCDALSSVGLSVRRLMNHPANSGVTEELTAIGDALEELWTELRAQESGGPGATDKIPGSRGED